uniref:centromere protein S-like isoform X1 n=2 Tax=Myxine glutinosa TaxID=7769 RepID=UPI00358EDCE1
MMKRNSLQSRDCVQRCISLWGNCVRKWPMMSTSRSASKLLLQSPRQPFASVNFSPETWRCLPSTRKNAVENWVATSKSKMATAMYVLTLHAKRTTVNCDDVKLLSRRSKSLHNFISKRSEELTMVNREMRGKKKRRTTKAVASKHKQEDDDQDGEADACTFPV